MDLIEPADVVLTMKDQEYQRFLLEQLAMSGTLTSDQRAGWRNVLYHGKLRWKKRRRESVVQREKQQLLKRIAFLELENERLHRALASSP